MKGKPNSFLGVHFIGRPKKDYYPIVDAIITEYVEIAILEKEVQKRKRALRRIFEEFGIAKGTKEFDMANLKVGMNALRSWWILSDPALTKKKPGRPPGQYAQFYLNLRREDPNVRAVYCAKRWYAEKEMEEQPRSTLKATPWRDKLRQIEKRDRLNELREIFAKIIARHEKKLRQ